MGLTSTRSFTAYISLTACVMTMAAMTFFSGPTWTGNDRYFSSAPLEMSFSRHFNDALAAFDHISVATPRHAEDIVAPDRQSIADVLFESHRQPGQDWRIAATAYRHIDPGRRAIA